MMDDASVEMLLRLVENQKIVMQEGAVIDADDPVISALIEALVERAQYLNEVGLEHLISKLKAVYVSQLPGMGLSSNDFTDEYKNKIDILYANKDKGMKYKVVSTLPTKGEDGYLYLVPLSSPSGQNYYAEYLWIGSQNKYELMGSVDLSNIKTDYLPLSGGTLTGSLSVPYSTITMKGNTVATSAKLNGSTYYANSNGLIDLGSIDMPDTGLQKVTVTVNGSSYSTNSSGTISLPTLAHQVKFNGTTYTASASGVVDLGSIDIPDGGLSKVTISLNGSTYSTNSSGTISLPTLAHTVTMNGSTKTASSSGNIALGSVVTSIKMNGTTHNPSSGTVDLGTVGGGSDNSVLTDSTIKSGASYDGSAGIVQGASTTPPAFYLISCAAGNSSLSASIAREILNKSGISSAPVGSIAVVFVQNDFHSWTIRKTSSSSW